MELKSGKFFTKLPDPAKKEQHSNDINSVRASYIGGVLRQKNVHSEKS